MKADAELRTAADTSGGVALSEASGGVALSESTWTRDLMPFEELYATVGFPAAYAWQDDLTSPTRQ